MAGSPINPLLRLSGMASGMDTEAMVKSLMTVEKLKADRVWQQKTRLEWHKSDRMEIGQKIAAFRTATMSVLSRDTNLNTSKAFNTFTVSQQTASAAVTVTATEQATAGQHEVTAITQLAKAAQASSGSAIAAATISRSDRLDALGLTVPLSFGGADGNTLEFTINDVPFAFSRETTLQEMFNQINASRANAVASYSELTGKVTLASRTSGLASRLTVANGAGNAFGPGSAFGIEGASWENGQDAVLKIDGIDVTRSSNSFTIDGLAYQLNDVTATSARFSVERDVEPTITRIRSFVTQYNSLLEFAQGKLNEESNPDYPPLTTEQREAMSESEARLWDEKSRSGLFRQDRSLTALVNGLRRMFSDTVSGTGRNAASLGLKTGVYTERGRISLDEAALRTALNENPDEVMRVFTQTSAESDATARYAASGLLPRMSEAFAGYAATFDTAETNQQIERLARRLDAVNTSLARKEENYWRRFSAMEQALYTLQNQSGWLSAQKL